MSIRDNFYNPTELAFEIVTGLNKDLSSPLDKTTTDSLEILLEGELAIYSAKYNNLYNQYAASEAKIRELTASYEKKIDEFQRQLNDERDRKKRDIDAAITYVAKRHDETIKTAENHVLELEKKIAELDDKLMDATMDAHNKRELARRLEREKMIATRLQEVAHDEKKVLQDQVDKLKIKLKDAQEETENWRKEILKTLTMRDAAQKALDVIVMQARQDGLRLQRRYDEQCTALNRAEQTIIEQRQAIGELEIELQDTIEDRYRHKHETPVVTRRTTGSLRTNPESPCPRGTGALSGELALAELKEEYEELQEKMDAEYMSRVIHDGMMEGKVQEVRDLQDERDDLRRRVEELEDEATGKNLGAAAAGDLRATVQKLERELRAAKDKITRLEQMKLGQGSKIARQQTRLAELKTRVSVPTRRFGAGGAGGPSEELAWLWDKLADVESRLGVHQTLLAEAKHERLALRQQRIQDALFHELKEIEGVHAHFRTAVKAALGSRSGVNTLQKILGEQALDFIRHRHSVFMLVQRIIPRTGETHRKYRDRTNGPTPSSRRAGPQSPQDFGDPRDIERNVRDLHHRFAGRLRRAQDEVHVLRRSTGGSSGLSTSRALIDSMNRQMALLEAKRAELHALLEMCRETDNRADDPAADPSDVFEAVGTLLKAYLAIVGPSAAGIDKLLLGLVALADEGSGRHLPADARRQLEAEAAQLYSERAVLVALLDEQVAVWDNAREGAQRTVEDLLADVSQGRVAADWLRGAHRVVDMYRGMVEKLARERDQLRGIFRVADGARVWLIGSAVSPTEARAVARPGEEAMGFAENARRLRDMLLSGTANFARDTYVLFLTTLKHSLVWFPLAGLFLSMMAVTIAEAMLYATWTEANAYSRSMWMSMLDRPTICLGPPDIDYIWFTIIELLPEEWGYGYY